MRKYFPVYIIYKNGLIHSLGDEPSVVTVDVDNIRPGEIKPVDISSIHYHQHGELIMSSYN
jgi:hypothetical protein